MTITKLLNTIPFSSFLVKTVVFFIYLYNKSVFLFIKKNAKSCQTAVICLQRIGDTIFTIPSIKYLYEKHGSNLLVICYDETEILLKKFVDVNLNTFCLSKKDIGYGLSLVKRSGIKKVKHKYYNQIFDLTGNITSFSLLIRLFSNYTYGINDRYFGIFFTKYIFKQKEYTLTEVFFNVIKLIDNKAAIENYISIPIKNITKIKVIINPFGGWAAKEWNFEKFIELYNLIQKDFEVNFNIDYSHDTQIIRELLNKNGIKYSVTKNLEELINLLEDYTLFIGNDSGPLYIAAMLGIPTLTIYGPTNPMHSMPKEKYHTFIRKEVECSPRGIEQYCYTDAGRDNCPKFICMDYLSVKEVYNHFLKFSRQIIEKSF